MTCPHTNLRRLWATGEDAPNKSLDTFDLCEDCGTIVHDYRHNGGLTSPHFPQYWEAAGVVRLRAELAALGERVVRRDGGISATCCDPVYIRRAPNGERVATTITLNEYQRANLLWLMCDVAGYDRPGPAMVSGLQTGDWAGEIPNALRVREDPTTAYEESTTRPNASGTPSEAGPSCVRGHGPMRWTSMVGPLGGFSCRAPGCHEYLCLVTPDVARAAQGL